MSTARDKGLLASLVAKLPAGISARHVQVPLRTKITLPYLLLALILALVAAYVVTNLIFDSLAERFANQLIEAGKISSEAIVSEEERLLGTLRLMSHTVSLPDAISAGDAEAVRQLVFPVALNGLEESVEILDASGKLIFGMRHRAGGHIEDYVFTQAGGEVLAAQPFVQRVLQGQADGQGDKFAGMVRAAWGDYLYVAGPVFDKNGHQVGIVLVGKSVPTLVRQVREATLAQISLYDQTGGLLASTLVAPVALDPGTAATVLSQQAVAAQQRTFAVTAIDYAELLGAWEVRDGQDLGIIGTALPQTFLLRTSQVTRVQVLTMVGLALVFILIIGSLVAQRITVPLLAVVKASAEVAQGNLGVEVADNSNDEVALLAKSFNHMVTNLRSSRQELLQAYDNTLAGWSRALDLRDHETEGHTQRVTEMTVRLASALGVGGDELLHIKRGALLHDIGKMGIPDNILLKPGRLTDDEWAIMKRHPGYAHDMLVPIDFLAPALDIPYCHHERWNGSGYPRGLQGNAIPRAARIFAVVDVWDALASNRPYRKAWTLAAVRDYLRSLSGVEFDPDVVAVFLELLDHDEAAAACAATSQQPAPTLSA